MTLRDYIKKLESLADSHGDDIEVLYYADEYGYEHYFEPVVYAPFEHDGNHKNYVIVND